jgi:hypothetical protein
VAGQDQRSHSARAGTIGGCRLPRGTLAHEAAAARELADHSLGLVVEGGDDLVGVLFRVMKSQAADREIDDFMTVPRSRPA